MYGNVLPAHSIQKSKFFVDQMNFAHSYIYKNEKYEDPLIHLAWTHVP
jgi:hypothetical protein